MIIGEMCLLIAATVILIGLAKGITARLYVNDHVAVFMIFVIVLLNVRGGIELGGNFRLFLGGALSVVLSVLFLAKRAETPFDAVYAMVAMLVNVGITLLYSLHFTDVVRLDMRLLAVLLSLLVGVWSAVAPKRTFASCLFTAVTGSFIGITLWQILFRKGGDIGGSYAFAVMWLGALIGVLVQYLFSFVLRMTRHPRANSLFEAGELKEKEAEENASLHDDKKDNA